MIKVYLNAKQYLKSEGLVADNLASRLTVKGRTYFEDWINEFVELDEEDKGVLNNKLPEKVKKYLGIGKDALSIIKSAKDLIEYLSN